MAAATAKMGIQIDEIDSEMIEYMVRRGKAKSAELAELVGITVPSIRVRLFQLMAQGLVSQRKTRNHHVWFFINENKKGALGFSVQRGREK